MHLPRLAPDRYRGFAFIHWSMSIDDRATGWLTPDFHNAFRAHLHHASACYHLICPMYCLMPDHIHLLWVGLRLASDQTLAVRRLRRGLNEEFNPLQFQKQAFDRVLREEERERGAFQSVAFYILANPVRAGLVERTEEYPYSGAVIEGFPEVNIHDEGYWEFFWRCYAEQRERSRAR